VEKNNQSWLLSLLNPSDILFLVFVFLAIMMCISCQNRFEKLKSEKTGIVKTGLEVFLEEYSHLVKGKKVGLITNPSGVDTNLQSTIKLFYDHPDIELIALYGSEHGVRGNAQPGEYVSFYVDEKFKLPVFSLYGQSRKPEPEMLKNIDAYMRSFDITEDDKSPSQEILQNCDVLVFDIQDVGTRIYTYTATMAYCMEACAELDIDFIVLDRPNPINGEDLEGNLLDYPEFSSFVGLYPIPARHGMTAGELSLLYNDKFLKKKVSLTVIPMKNWKRGMWFDGTGLPWVMPSPNMPTLNTAMVYPGQVLLEGTNVSEGRGTTRPFELFGAPWIDGFELTEQLNALNLQGVVFREAWFTPTFSKHKEQLCGGAQIHVTDREEFQPFAVSLHILRTVMDLYPESFLFHDEYFDSIMGTNKIRQLLESGESVDFITESHKAQHDVFHTTRKPYLLYDD
jgi:uncharacterized protein YbbC (DUF1343 family)